MVQQWNPSQKSAQIALTGTPPLTANNRSLSNTDADVYALNGVTTGKFYWETTGTSDGVGDVAVGIGNTSSGTSAGVGGSGSPDIIAFYAGSGHLWWNSVLQASFGATNDTVPTLVCHALDLVNGFYWVRLGTGGNWNASGIANPATPSGGISVTQAGSTITAHPVVPMADIFSDTGGSNVVAAFSSFSWQGTAPAGFAPFDTSPTPLTGTFYVDNSIGLDTYDGTAPTHTGGTTGPWASILHVNAQAFNGGSTILFQGGQTFTGGVAPLFGTSPALSSSNPLTFGSFGTGQATISSGSSNAFNMTNIGGFIINNFICTGDGITASVNIGINIENTHSPDVTYDYIQVNNCIVTLYGFSGIFVQGTSGTGGYSNITISGNTVHDCGGFPNYPFSSGIEVQAPVSTLAVVSGIYNFTNVLVAGNTVYNITGTGGTAGDSGFPIWLSECNNGLVTLCVAHDSGTNNGNVGAGPAGINIVDCNNTKAQFCEVYNISDGGFNVDGDGYNVASSINSGFQYCYSHDNNGCGYLLDNGARAVGLTGAFVRYCISQNDGNNASGNLRCGVALVNENSDGVTADVYNNTTYSSNGSGGISIQTNLSGISGRVNNNIFYTTTGESVSTSGNPPITFDGNDYYRTSGFSLVWNGTTYTTLASWIGGGYGQETVNGGFTSNPSLVNPGGGGTTNGYNPGLLTAYRLQAGSPMFGAGLNMNAHFSINPGTQDYYGDRIPHGAGSGFPVGAAGAITTPSLPLMGVGMIGWRAPLLGAAAWKFGKAIAKNGIITRRRFLLPK